MTHNLKNPVTCLPEETSREGLCDLETDHLRETAGSMLHNLNGFQASYIPEFVFHQVRLQIGTRNSLFNIMDAMNFK